MDQLHKLANVASKNSSALRKEHKASRSTLAALSAALQIGINSEVAVSVHAIVHGRLVCRGDVVMYQLHGQTKLGCVSFHARIDNDAYTCLAPWEILEHVSPLVCKCTVRTETFLVPVSALQHSCIFSKAMDGQVSTVLLSRWM